MPKALLGRTLPEKQTNSSKRSEVALCLFVNKQSRLFRKISLRPPQNKCCSLELQPKRYFLQYLNCVAQLNLQLRLFEFVCFSAKVRPYSTSNPWNRNKGKCLWLLPWISSLLRSNGRKSETCLANQCSGCNVSSWSIASLPYASLWAS